MNKKSPDKSANQKLTQNPQKNGVQFAFALPEWTSKIKDEEVKRAVESFILSEQIYAAIHGKNEPIDNLREYLKDVCNDRSDEQIEEIARLLIDHKIVRPNKK